MAEHRPKRGNEDQDQNGDLLRHELERERRWEHAEERRVSRAIGLTDFLAVLMVIATGFSAFATWRTAQVTSLVFAIADRPFMGVAKVEFEATDSPDPHLTVVYKNFGRIPAVDGLVSVDALIDGKPAPDPFPGAMDVHETGSIAPDVDHFFYRYLNADSYKDASAENRDFESKCASTTRGSPRTLNIASSSGSSTITGVRPSGTPAAPT